MKKVKKIINALRENNKAPSIKTLKKLTGEEKNVLFEKLLEVAQERKIALDKYLIHIKSKI